MCNQHPPDIQPWLHTFASRKNKTFSTYVLGVFFFLIGNYAAAKSVRQDAFLSHAGSFYERKEKSYV